MKFHIAKTKDFLECRTYILCWYEIWCRLGFRVTYHSLKSCILLNMSKALPYSICSYQSDFASSSSVIQSTIGFNLWDSSSVRCTEDSDRDLVINLFSSERKVLNGHNGGRFFDRSLCNPILNMMIREYILTISNNNQKLFISVQTEYNKNFIFCF